MSRCRIDTNRLMPYRPVPRVLQPAVQLGWVVAAEDTSKAHGQSAHDREVRQRRLQSVHPLRLLLRQLSTWLHAKDGCGDRRHARNRRHGGKLDGVGLLYWRRRGASTAPSPQETLQMAEAAGVSLLSAPAQQFAGIRAARIPEP